MSPVSDRDRIELRLPMLRRAVKALGLDEHPDGEQLDDLDADGEDSVHLAVIVRLGATLPVIGPHIETALERVDELADARARRRAMIELGRSVAPAVAQIVLAEESAAALAALPAEQVRDLRRRRAAGLDRRRCADGRTGR